MIQVHIARRSKNSDDMEYLVLKRSSIEQAFPNVWQVVTGGIEPLETAVEAARREMFEETGLSPITMWSLPYVASYYSPKKDEIQYAPVFGALVDAKDVLISEEHEEFVWLRFEDTLSRLVFPSHIEGTKFFHESILFGKDKIHFLKV